MFNFLVVTQCKYKRLGIALAVPQEKHSEKNKTKKKQLSVSICGIVRTEKHPACFWE